MWFWFNTANNEFEKQDTFNKSESKSDSKQDCKEYEVITEEKTEEQEPKSEQDCEDPDLILMKLKNVEARMLELEYKIDDIVTLLHEIQQRAESPNCDCYKDCFNFYDPTPTLEKETQTELDKFLEETLQVNLGNELVIGKKNFSKSLDKTETANTFEKSDDKRDKDIADIAEKPLILKCFDKVEEKQKKKPKPKPKVPTRIRKSKRVINKNLKDKESNTIINNKIWKT
tara:strand:+ start:14 stop:700 length:687 start_codon:yes stop_codon:yes gene_type:complete